MTTVRKQIQNASEAICQNIESLTNQRALLSINILSQSRNLVEGVAVLFRNDSPDSEFHYDAVRPALKFIKGKGNLNFLGKFHNFTQQSSSHYTLDGDNSERLMLKYYEYLYRIRKLMHNDWGISVLENLENFPIDLDPSLKEYYGKITDKIEDSRSVSVDYSEDLKDRYYIHRTRPFFVKGGVYYEVTFYRAVNKVNKFDRMIAFTDYDIATKYAVMLTLQRHSIDVLGQTMPIMIIRDWEVSIRPCELDNFARLLGIQSETRKNSKEYRHLMRKLTKAFASLLEIVDLPDDEYANVRAEATADITSPNVFLTLDKVRDIVRRSAPGQNVLRYLMLRMRNQVLKLQYDPEGSDHLSGLNLKRGCIPFDNMPFCTSLLRHNPMYWDLVEAFDANGRDHELLARRVKNNVETLGLLYTPVADLEEFGDINLLSATYNNSLYYKHVDRKLVIDKRHIFICGYENDTVAIISRLRKFASSAIAGYTRAVERWLEESPRNIDDPVKANVLKHLFSQSRVGLIYGAAGTGKSTIVNHIAHFFNDKKKLFLAYTNPAINNLKRKVTAKNSDFRTIKKQLSGKALDSEYDLLIIDECSTVSNADLVQVLNSISFKLLVFVGDIYQIESIRFGNWFEIVRSFLPSTSVFELTMPFRTSNKSLLGFWRSVRNIDEDIAEIIARKEYSTILDKTLFENQAQDEIVLCLNYDGLYGINNINRFLQSRNSRRATIWRESTYKIGDPVLFHESERFSPVIYNNLKGWIINIACDRGWIEFDVELDRPLNELDVVFLDLEYITGSTVRFRVYDDDTSDQDNDSLNTTVPFQVSYAVSIHKAQGLEYDSVKIVITEANDDDISHSIFYTAVTRAREHLRIFWTPETQQNVLERLRRPINRKDVCLLSSRRDLSLVIQ